MANKKKYNIYDRSLEFAVKSAELINFIPKTPAFYVYSKQLLRASASIGANVEEADGALTKKDFINKMGIARREARESRHWLLLIEKTGLIKQALGRKELQKLICEAKELLLILSSIINNTKRKISKNPV
jgi:four helix bundle protein